MTIIDLLLHVGNMAVPAVIYMDIDMTWANDFRKRLKRAGQNVTVTAILLKAIAIAQKIHPESRTEWLPFGRRVIYEDIVAGFTVEREINGQQTVLLGEIESPIEKSIEQIGAELKEHAEYPVESVKPLQMQNIFSYLPPLVRAMILDIGKCFPSLRLQCQKATFGLTSLGKFGILDHTCPCLCSCSLSVGTMEERLVVREKEIVTRTMMTVGLNFNNNAIDSPSAARFLQTIRNLMEGEIEEWLPTVVSEKREEAPLAGARS